MTTVRSRSEYDRLTREELREELDRVCRLFDEAESARVKQQVRLKMLAEQWAHGKAVQLLMAHEWVTDGRECVTYCLHCRREQRNGHAEDCEGFGLHGVVPPDVRAALESEVK